MDAVPSTINIIDKVIAYGAENHWMTFKLPFPPKTSGRKVASWAAEASQTASEENYSL